MPRQSLLEYIERFERLGDAIAIIQRRGCRSIRWSYLTIAERCFQFSRELEARNVKPGDAVLLWGQNSAEWIVAFWGSLLRGAVVVPMDNIASADFAQRVCRQVDAKLIVCARDKPALD